MVAESSDKEKTYELQDGDITTVGGERFQFLEVPLPPSMAGMETGGTHDTTFQSIANVPESRGEGED